MGCRQAGGWVGGRVGMGKGRGDRLIDTKLPWPVFLVSVCERYTTAVLAVIFLLETFALLRGLVIAYVHFKPVRTYLVPGIHTNKLQLPLILCRRCLFMIC